ncbi:CRF2 protein, partial [Atractosteus spatula]|uniref:Corticotropin releasing hormone b n=2 Tax=Lepisosteidae TaxID=7915 RepID=W5NMQ8_LEPOC|nr:PREDICTED: corticoliberin [Lepisosteus oculatus]MBN3322349.1 CRF2 protein [Atractosteus spatula]
MKLNFLVSTAILLVAFLPRHECRAIESPGAVQSGRGSESELQELSLPLLVRLGEEYFIRLGNVNQNPPSYLPNMSPDASPANVNRAFQMQLTQRLLQGKVGHPNRLLSSHDDQLEDLTGRGKRSEEPPISLDLTFHLLREVLEMARAEQLAQQAHSNRKMMEIIGK